MFSKRLLLPVGWLDGWSRKTDSVSSCRGLPPPTKLHLYVATNLSSASSKEITCHMNSLLCRKWSMHLGCISSKQSVFLKNNYQACSVLRVNISLGQAWTMMICNVMQGSWYSIKKEFKSFSILHKTQCSASGKSVLTLEKPDFSSPPQSIEGWLLRVPAGDFSLQLGQS